MSQQITLDQAFSSVTKAISNPPSNQPDPKKNQLLRKKRNLEIIERNYLIRRFYYPIRQNSEYELEAKTYSIFNHFDFDSPPYNKFSSIKNISANAFWFLICSNYFPYYANELIDQKEYIPEELKKLIDYINNNNISINKKNPNLGDKFNFLKNLKTLVNNFSKKKNNLNEKNNLFQTTSINPNLNSNNQNNSNIININENKSNINISNLSCTNNISSIKSLLENLIKYFEHENETNIPSKIKKDFLLTSNYNRDVRVPEDFELDIKYHTKSFKRFREEVLDKEEQNEEDENDDIVCYVCGDGEYEDDNLILYCSKCNMTVHQKCYGVLVIPEEDWICHLCRAFNDINICNNMECILCPNLGGAMKPCTLRKSTHSYKIMIKNRKNPFLKENNNKIINLNNNLINSISISDDNKDNKNMENNINNNIKNENNNNNNIHENNIFASDISQIPNRENLIPPNPNCIMNIINNNIKTNSSNNDLNSNSNNNNNNNNNNNLTNSLNNNSNNENNIMQNSNILDASCRSSNIKDSDSILSSSSNKINTKEENENNNNPINNNKNLLKKQSQNKRAHNEIYLSEKLAKENAWVHLSCALWLPELNLANFDLKEKIKGVENIPKKRLQEECNICLKCGYGPTIKCEKCDYHFHPECARRLKNFFLEINENENGETTFLAYCNKDAPPKHLKKYELIKQRKRDDIKKFSTLLQKDISSLNKLSDDKQYNIFHPYCYNVNNIEMKKIINEEKKIFKKIGKNNNSNENNNNYIYNNEILNESVKKSINNNSFNYEKSIELTSSEKKCLINAIREMLIDESNLTLEINSEDYSIKTNNNIKLTYDDILYPEKFSWCFLKENQYYLNGISNYETFKIFQSLIPNKIDYAKNILKEKISIPEKPKKHKIKIKQKNKTKKEEELKYCICNKNNKLDNNWVGCENENGKCPGNGWFHITCIPELQKYNIETFKNHFEHYYCPKCRELFKLVNVIKKVNEVNEINVPINLEENSNNINISINNNENSNMDLEFKKQESNIVECVNINNNEYKSEENNKNGNNNGICPMEIEEKIKEDNKDKIEDKTH